MKLQSRLLIVFLSKFMHIFKWIGFEFVPHLMDVFLTFVPFRVFVVEENRNCAWQPD